MNLAKLKRIIAVFILSSNSILAFAEFDGRYADLPSHHHHTPIWLCAIIGTVIIVSIIKGIRNDIKSNRNKEGNPVQQKKIYTAYGRYSECCPMCSGKGWILGDEKSFLGYMNETVECNECHGFGQILNDEAIQLYTELQQLRREKAERQEKVKAERRKLEDEAYERYALEIKDKYNGAIKSVREAGRRILSKTEYEDGLREILSKRSGIRHKMWQLLTNQPTCPKCSGDDKQCDVCHGSGHLFNEKANELYSIWKSLWDEFQTLYSDYHSIYDNDPSREAFDRKNSPSYNRFELGPDYGTYQSQLGETNGMRKRIKEIIKKQPICYHCRGTGSIRIFVNQDNHTYRKQLGCPECKGRGVVFYN